MAEELSPLFPHTRWLQVNWEALVKANIPAMSIVDKLVHSHVFNPWDDDYQRIQAEPTPLGKVRILLETMRPKSAHAFDLFKEALAQSCPDVFTRCVEPPHALAELDSAACLHYKNLEVNACSWLPDVQPIQGKTLFLNLSMVEKKVAKSMMSSLASSSAREIERQEYLYSRPESQKLVRLDSLFPQTFRNDQTSQAATAARDVKSSVFDTSSLLEATQPSVTNAGPSSFPPNVCGDEKDPQSVVLQSAQRVGIYGGAGCGKTSCLTKAASLYAEKQLWQGARTFLLWKLRDPNVQEASSLTQLLRQLSLDLTEKKCEELASVLSSSDGEDVILALDGIDELDTKVKGYVRRLLDGSALKKAYVLATSRPCSTARTYFDRYGVNLELLGFTEEQVDQFIQQQLGDDPKVIAELHQLLLENPTLASLMLVPLLAMMICQVFRLTAREPPTTRTKLFLKLLILVLQRTVEESEGRVSIPAGQIDDILMASEADEIEGEPGRLLSELAELAFLAHEDGKAVFTHNFVRKVAKVSNESLQVGLLVRFDVQKGTAIMPQYSFQHLTVQEFLVAYRLVAHITSEEELGHKVRVLLSSAHNHVVLQFFAGLLMQHLRTHFFALLDQWLHEKYDWLCTDCCSRLRVCLQCAKEACGGKMTDFPSTLRLPQRIFLEHVTAADLTQLSLGLAGSEHIEWLSLSFDKVLVPSEERKVTRVKTQTRRAMTRLMVAINANKSLRNLCLNSPRYSLFEEEGWRLLVETITRSNALEYLAVDSGGFDSTSFPDMSKALRQSSQLTELSLQHNGLNDASVRKLADDLKHSSTLQKLNLLGNNYGEDSREHLRHLLQHVPRLYV